MHLTKEPQNTGRKNSQNCKKQLIQQLQLNATYFTLTDVTTRHEVSKDVKLEQDY